MSLTEASLEIGKSYLHRNLLFIRTIDSIHGDLVLWHDKHGDGRCTRKVFVRQCITLAPDSERSLDDIKAEIEREGVVSRSRSKTEMIFEARCYEAKENKSPHVVVNDPRELGSTYEEVMRSLLVLEEQHLYLRIIP